MQVNDVVAMLQERLDKEENQLQFLNQLLWLSLHNRGPLRAPVLEMMNWPDGRLLSIQTVKGKVVCKAMKQTNMSQSSQPLQTTPLEMDSGTIS